MRGVLGQVLDIYFPLNLTYTEDVKFRNFCGYSYFGIVYIHLGFSFQFWKLENLKLETS